MQWVEEGHASSFSVNRLGMLLVKSSKVENRHRKGDVLSML